MYELDVRASGSRMETYAREQARIARGVGEELIIFRQAFGDIPGWLMRLKDKCPELDDFSPADLSIFYRAAEAYSAEEWGYGFPWCVYAYAVRHTVDPAGWVRRALSENWKFSDMRRHILDSKTRKVSEEEGPALKPHEIRHIQVTEPDGTPVGSLSIFIDIMDTNADPYAVLELAEQVIRPAGMTALRMAFELCEREVEDYLGLTRIVRSEAMAV